MKSTSIDFESECGLALPLQTVVVGVPGGTRQDNGWAAIVHHQDLELCAWPGQRGFDIGKGKRLIDSMAVGAAGGQTDDPVAVIYRFVAIAIVVSGSN